MPMIAFNQTPKTYNLISTIVGPLGLALDAVYSGKEGKPEIQKVIGHFASIGPALALLLDEDYIKELATEWQTQLPDAVGTAVAGAVPLAVNGAKLIIHFAQKR